MEQFATFCALHDLRPATEKAVVVWIMHCMENLHLKQKTLQQKIAAYKWAHRVVWNLGEPRGALLPLVERNVTRLARDSTPKLAVGRKDLCAVLRLAETQFPVAVFKQLRAWWCLSYAAFLRCSEVGTLKWVHVCCDPLPSQGAVSSIEVTLAVEGRVVFKNHKESIKLKLVRSSEQFRVLCPLRSLVSWWRVAPLGGRVFQLDVGMVRRSFQSMAAQALGGLGEQYGLHSLRAGAATDAEADGRHLSEIMFQGRWKSATVLQYMRNGEQLASVLGVQLSGRRNVRVFQPIG
jgi:hypothetical protein